MASLNDSHIITLTNNGKSRPFTNACMFIAISDYLKYVKLNESVTVKSLRKESKFRGKNNMFDTHNKRHTKALKYITDKYNLKIFIHYYNTSIYKKYISKFCHTFGEGKNEFSILYYGDHFELLLSAGEFTQRLKLDEIALRNDKRNIYKRKVITENNELIDIQIRNFKLLKDDLINLKYLYKHSESEELKNKILILKFELNNLIDKIEEMIKKINLN